MGGKGKASQSDADAITQKKNVKSRHQPASHDGRRRTDTTAWMMYRGTKKTHNTKQGRGKET